VKRRFWVLVKKLLQMGDDGLHILSAAGGSMVSSKVGLAVAIAVVCGWLWYYVVLFRKSKGKSNKAPLPPGSFGLPILGETLEFLRLAQANKAGAEFVKPRVAKYGQVRPNTLPFSSSS
jgi:cytochrome P450 family 26 subfamily A